MSESNPANQPPRVIIEAALIAQALMEASNAAIAVITPDRIITSWSRGAAELFGCSAAQVIGRSLDTVLPPDDEAKAAARVPRDGTEPYEVTRPGHDGKSVCVEISLTPVLDAVNATVGFLAVMRDVTDRKDAETAARDIAVAEHHRTVIIETANRVALDILSSRTGVEALRHIADAARVLAGARYSALGVARRGERGGQELEIFVTVGITPQEQAKIGPLPRGRGILGLLLERSEPLRIDKLSQHPASVGFPRNHPPMTSFLGVPIRRGAEVLGSLYLTDKQGGGPFTEADEVAVQAIGAHAAVAIQNLHLLARQQALTHSLLTAQEEERRAVAYDLHDGLTQFVMGAHAHLQAFQRAQTDGNAEKAGRELEVGLRYLKESVVESRRLVNNLRLLILDDLGLAGALEQLVQEEKERAGWAEVELLHNLGEERFDRTLETAAYRIAQEALTNARKHAAAPKVLLKVRQQIGDAGRELHLEIRDWGCGFVPEEGIAKADHVGLQGIIERVHLLNGSYDLQSAPGQGSALKVILPVRESVSEKATAEE